MLRKEIWLYKADPTIGDEINKTRPCIIVNNDEMGVLRLKIVIPITAWNELFATVPWMVTIEPSKENGLNKLSVADTFQIRSVSQERLIKRIGLVSESTMNKINNALSIVLDINN